MTGREFICQVAEQMARIESVERWSEKEKALQIRLLFESSCETWAQHGWATAEHLLALDKGSNELNGKPAAGSLYAQAERRRTHA